MKKTGIVSLVMSCVMSMSLFSFVSAGSVLADDGRSHRDGPWADQYVGDDEEQDWKKEANSDWMCCDFRGYHYRLLDEKAFTDICGGKLPVDRAEAEQNYTVYFLGADLDLDIATDKFSGVFNSYYYDLNGYNINYNVEITDGYEGNQYLFNAEQGGAHIYLRDSSKGSVKGSIISTKNAPIGLADNNADFHVEVPINGSQNAYAETNARAFTLLNGELELKAEISGFSATRGGAVYIEAGTLRCDSGAKITNCHADEGGAIFSIAGTLYLNNGTTISGNTAESRGGGLCINGELNDTQLTCSNCYITENICYGLDDGEGGGGIYCYPSISNRYSLINMNYTVVVDNNYSEDGNSNNIFFAGYSYRDKIDARLLDMTNSHVGVSREVSQDDQDWFYSIVVCDTVIDENVFFSDSSDYYLSPVTNGKELKYYNCAVPHFLGYSVLVDGAVGLKMYFELPDDYFTNPDYVYRIKSNGTEEVIKTFANDEFIPVENEPHRYYAIAYIPPIDLANSYYSSNALRVYYDDKVNSGTTVSLSDYRTAIQRIGTEKDKIMVDAVIDYCYGVSAIKSGWYYNPIVSSYTRPYDTEDIDEPDPIVSSGPFAYKGSSLVANSETKLKHYFTIEDGSDVSKVSVYVDGVKMKVYNAGNGYYNVTITNINFFQAGTRKTVVVKYDGVDQYSFSYSPCDYLYKAVAAGDGKDNKGTYIFAKAFYNLYRTMIDYNTPNE